MSKRKNPLQNLDEFLKQEATSFVTPKKLSEPKPIAPAPQTSVVSEPQPSTAKPADVTAEYILNLIQKLANKNNVTVRQQLLELVRLQLEENGIKSSKDKMLINTILYLQSGDSWKEKVAEYWEKASIANS